jgi:hypothetical protein
MLLVFGSTGVHGADDASRDRAWLVQAGYDDDADGFGGWLSRAGYLFNYTSPYDYAGVALQDVHYVQDGWSDDVVGAVGLFRRQRRDTLEGIRGEAGVVSVGGELRPVGDLTWSLRPRPSTGIELIAAGDVVGTRAAIERSISYGLAAVSVEQQFGARWTAVGLAGWQPFTDGNARTVLRGRVICSLVPEQGLSAQVRYRQYSSREDDVDGAYFNPDTYRVWDAGLALRRHVGDWTVAGLVATGQERAEQGAWNSTQAAELRLEGPIGNRSRLSVGALYSRAAGFNASPDYWYGSINANLIVPLR